MIAYYSLSNGQVAVVTGDGYEVFDDYCAAREYGRALLAVYMIAEFVRYLYESARAAHRAMALGE